MRRGLTWRITGVLAVAALAFALGYAACGNHKEAVRTRVAREATGTETIYIRDAAPRYFSGRAVLHDIPAWEEAANKQFSPYWGTPRVKIVLLRKHQALPVGGILATFKQKGPVQGALAYHDASAFEPYIVVYSGTSQYYGYSVSEDFTHELFEMLVDRNVSEFNIGYLSPFYYVGQEADPMPQYAPWFNEVCDPVEKYGYKLHGVQISDFVTPAWFNDPGSAGPKDALGLVQYPFQVLQGGYAQFVINGQDHIIQDLRHAGRDAAGFLKGEKLESR